MIQNQPKNGLGTTLEPEEAMWDPAKKNPNTGE